MIAILFFSFFGLLFLSVSIAGSMAGASLITLLAEGSSPLLVVQKMFTGVDSFPMMAIPFFMLSGAIMERGGVSRRLVNLVALVFENLPGGLAIITIVTSMFFGAISGSAPATVAAIGGLCVPMMTKEGYNDRFALATAATAGCLGSIIPPSIVMVTYCVACNVSVGDLFLAGIGAGGILTLGFCLYALYYGKKNGYYAKVKVKHPSSQVIHTVMEAVPAIMMPVIILGGIYSGIFTATEAGCIAVIYGFFVGFFIYKELAIKDLPGLFKNAMGSTSMVMFILAGATALGSVMTRLQVPAIASSFIIDIAKTPVMFLLLVNVLLFIVGMIMESNTAILLLAPILTPVAIAMDISLLHFGIIMIVNLVLGMCTPPVGMNLFVAAGVGKCKVEHVVCKSQWIYLAVGFAILAVFTYVEDVALISYNLFH